MKASQKQLIEQLSFFLFLLLLAGLHFQHSRSLENTDPIVIIEQAPQQHQPITTTYDRQASKKTPSKTKATQTAKNHTSDQKKTTGQHRRKESSGQDTERTTTKAAKTQENSPSYTETLDLTQPDKDALMASGLHAYPAGNLVKYIKAGGKIKSKEALLKIYGMEPEWVEKNEHLIRYHPSKRQWTPTPEIESLEINTADSSQWLQLRGIGPAYSGRILRFRRALGGFHSIEQVAETYGLPDSVYTAILPKLVLNSSPSKINIYASTVEELAAHPYISFKEARLIKKYVEAHNDLQSVEQLKKIYGIRTERLSKMLPYLDINPQLLTAHE